VIASPNMRAINAPIAVFLFNLQQVAFFIVHTATLLIEIEIKVKIAQDEAVNRVALAK
jgi:hypothetical protein